MVPVAMVQLDEAGAAFREAAGEDAVGGEAGRALFRSVLLEGGVGFLGEVHQLRDAGLHAEGEFVVRDLGGDGGVAERAELEAV